MPEEDTKKEPETPVADEGKIVEVEEPKEAPKPTKRTKLKSLAKHATSTKKRKLLVILASVVAILVILIAIPLTRYAIFGSFVKKNVMVSIKDSQTGKMVSGVTVRLGNATGTTDKDGNVTVKNVAAGQYSLQISKNYYKSVSTGYTVGLFTSPKQVTEKLTALGRQVTFMVTDKISGKPLADAKFVVNGSNAITDAKGEAVIVLPPNQAEQKGMISKSGYNDGAAIVFINGAEKSNTFALTPSGSIVYLSNASGTIDVVKASLDGSNASKIVTGTGKEDRYATSLLSSKDWKFSVLKSKRNADSLSLNLVNTASGEMTNIDEGKVNFTMVGWAGHKFVYIVNRGLNQWQDKNAAIKLYDAETGKLMTLDETYATGNGYYDAQYQYYGDVYTIGNEIVFTKQWGLANSYYASDGSKSALLVSIDTTSLKRRTIKEFVQHQTYGVLNLALYEPQGVYVYLDDSGNREYYEYEDGNIKTISKSDTDGQYPTFLSSPSGNKTFWYELRDGKNTIFIGNKEGKDQKQIASLSEYVPYGWYGDDDQYILFTKKESELYIAPATAISGTPLKVTDYYKVQSYPGYGGGYGGQ